MPRSLGALLLATIVLAPAPSFAQDAKTVRLIVPFAAGGPADALARAVGPGMSTALGQSVVVDNRGGAGGVLGVDAVAKAAPDGTTIGLGGFGAMTVLPFIRPAPYDVLRDLAPITLVGRNSGVLVTHPKRGFKTVADLVAFAKANPKKINFASAGTGTSIHLSGELFASGVGHPARARALCQGRGAGDHRSARRPCRHDAARHLRRARARPLRRAGCAGGHRREALAATAGRPDHGRGRLSQGRLGDLVRADRAGQDAGGDAQLRCMARR